MKTTKQDHSAFGANSGAVVVADFVVPIVVVDAVAGAAGSAGAPDDARLTAESKDH